MNFFRKAVWTLAALIVFYQCMIPPAVGLADNGDFIIVAGRLGLDVPDRDDPDRFFVYTAPAYFDSPAPAWVDTVLTSEIPMQAPAWLLRKLVSKSGLFDMRWAGATHAALFLLALWLILPLFRFKAAALGAVFIFTDVAYVSYFSSFHTDAAALVTLLLVLSLAARLAFGRESTCAGLTVATVLFSTAKAQHTLLGVPVLLFLCWIFPDLKRRMGTKLALIPIVALAVSIVVMVGSTPKRYRGLALYNLVFHHILPNSADPAGALRELGLPEAYVKYSQSHSYSADSVMFDPSFHSTFLEQASFARVGLYYLRHPEIPTGLMRAGYRDARVLRPEGWGNFARESGYERRKQSEAFALWSQFKTWLFYWHPWAHRLYWPLPLAVILWFVHFRESRLRPAAYMLIAMGIGAFLIATLGDVRDTSRHLFLFNTLLDVNFVCAVSAVLWWWKHRSEAV